MPSADELAILRALPMEVKVQKSKQRIRNGRGKSPLNMGLFPVGMSLKEGDY